MGITSLLRAPLSNGRGRSGDDSVVLRAELRGERGSVYARVARIRASLIEDIRFSSAILVM